MIRQTIGKNARKVCIITDQFPPYPMDIQIMRGGIDIGMKQLYDEFVKKRYNTFVISQNYIKKLKGPDDENVIRIRTYHPYSLEKNMIKNGFRFLVNETFNPFTLWSFYKILKKYKPDTVIIGGTRQLSIAPILATQILNIPLFIRYDWICPTYPRNDICDTWRRINNCGDCVEKYNNLSFGKISNLGLGILSGIIFKIKLRLWKRASAILPVNEFYSNMYQKYGIPRKNLHVIPTSRLIKKVPITTKKFIQLRDKSKVLLIYVGRLSPEKGIMMLIDSFEEVVKNRNGIYLIIAGDGIQRNEVYERANKNDKITYLGWQTEEQLSELYQLSDALIIPTIVPEGHPRSAEEAMGFGKVIIGFDLGGLHEIFEKYPKSIKVDAINIHKLSDAIVEAIGKYFYS